VKKSTEKLTEKLKKMPKMLEFSGGCYYLINYTQRGQQDCWCGL